jgi:cytochrome c
MTFFPMTTLSLSLALVACGSLQAEDSMQSAAMGAKVFAENCNRCHEAPDPASRDGRTWTGISLHMRVFADLSQEDQHRVLAFLRTFDTAAIPKKPGVPAAR